MTEKRIDEMSSKSKYLHRQLFTWVFTHIFSIKKYTTQLSNEQNYPR